MNRKTVKSLLPALTLIALLLFLASRKEEEKLHKRSQFVMGTFVEITILDEGVREKADAVINAAFGTMKRIEGLLGRHQEGSDIWRVNHAQGEAVTVSEETLAVVKKALEFSRISGGAFDITVGRLSELWNFEEERKEPPHSDEVKKALSGRGEASIMLDEEKGTIKVPQGVRLDLGAIAKGFIIDRAGEVLLAEGVRNFIINAGGDMIIRGKKGGEPWRVGVQHPRKANEILARIDVDEEETAIVTSGDYERFFIHEGRRYHHILDPATGYPATGLMSATVKAADAITADALSTAIFVLGREKGLQLVGRLNGVEAMVVDGEGAVSLSAGLEKRAVIK